VLESGSKRQTPCHPLVDALYHNNAGADINTTNKFQETPLYRACTRKKLGAIRALIRSGANVNALAKYVVSVRA